jgi:hypothetical protein
MNSHDIEYKFLQRWTSMPWWDRLLSSRKNLARVMYAQGRCDGAIEMQRFSSYGREPENDKER